MPSSLPGEIRMTSAHPPDTLRSDRPTGRQGSDHVPQLRARNGDQVLTPDDPYRPAYLDRRGQTRKCCMASRLAQRGDNAGGLDPDKIRLRIDDKLSALQTKEIELRHRDQPSEVSETCQGHSRAGHVFGIGRKRRAGALAPPAVRLDPGRVGNRG